MPIKKFGSVAIVKRSYNPSKIKTVMKDRKIKYELTFSKEGTFQSYYEATGWCSENGYSFGSMCGPLPIALMKGDFISAKWKNLTTQERQKVDGIMTGDFRNGEVTIIIYEPALAKQQ
jgi:hypothetical protein